MDLLLISLRIDNFRQKEHQLLKKLKNNRAQ
jgi:hypothetical protein